MWSGIVYIFGGGLVLSWPDFCILSYFSSVFSPPAAFLLLLVTYMLFPEQALWNTYPIKSLLCVTPSHWKTISYAFCIQRAATSLLPIFSVHFLSPNLLSILKTLLCISTAFEVG